MSSVVDALTHFRPTPIQRLWLVWAFVANGLIICVQLSQTQSPTPFAWTRLTDRTRSYWYTAYVLEAFLFFQNMYPMLLKNMNGYFLGHEEQILNTVWVGLLGIEILMVLSVAVRGLVKGLGGPALPKQKTT